MLQIIDVLLQIPAGPTHLTVAQTFCRKKRNLHRLDLEQPIILTSLPRKKKQTLIKIYSAAISDLFIMQKQKQESLNESRRKAFLLLCLWPLPGTACIVMFHTR